MRRLMSVSALTWLLVLVCLLAGIHAAGCGTSGATQPAPLEEPPAPPVETGGKALDGAQDGGDEVRS